MKLPTFALVDVPAKIYKDQHQPLTTAGALLGVQTDTRLPEDLEYKIATVAFEKKNTWMASFPAAKNFDQKELTLQSKIPLAAGTVRYLEKHGVKVPANLIPPEYKK